MTPEQFLAKVPNGTLAPAYLFVGQEGYQRRLCKDALIERVLPKEARADGITTVDLDETELASIIDDARSMSLFASDRLIWVGAAEAALPRRLSSAREDEESGDNSSQIGQLKEYLASPTPGTVIVFECSRYDFNGDDRPKLERVQKFYSVIQTVVEFRQFTPEASRLLAQQLARKFNVKLGGPELAALLEAVAGDATRLAVEIEKLALFVDAGKSVVMEDLRTLVPNAGQTTVFALVRALGENNRVSALHSLDILIREGEYLPLALTFLNTQFRLALAAKEAKISSAQQAQAFFTKLGVRIWRDRAEQVVTTAGAFSQQRLSAALTTIYETDKKFREGFRDDRVVMETLVMTLTGR